MALAQKAVEIAISQLGAEEKPRGSNWGEPVKTYLHSVGLDIPASWCMAFTYWCFEQAAHSLNVVSPLIRTGGVLKAWHMVQDSRKVYKDYQPGDIFIMDHGHGLGHTGIIESSDGKYITTIEGNTNDTGSREGYAVCRKKRLITSIIGALRY